MTHLTAHHRQSRWQHFLAGFDRREQELARVQARNVPAAAEDPETTATMPVIVDGPHCGHKGHAPGDETRFTCEDCAPDLDVMQHYATADKPEQQAMILPRHGRTYSVHADVVLAELRAEVERAPMADLPVFVEPMPVAAVRPWLPPVEPEPVAVPEPDPIDLAVAELMASFEASFALHLRELGLARKVEMAVSL